MRMDTSIPLQIQGPDIMGAMDRGTQAATNYNALRQQNALADIYRTQGAGIMAGDPTALNALAGMDPAAALGIQNTRQGMQADRQRMDMLSREEQRQIAAHAANMSAAERAAAAAELEGAVKFGLALPNAAAWDAEMSKSAPDLVGKFDNRFAEANRYMSMAEIIKGQQPPSPSDQFKVVGSQLIDLAAEGGPKAVITSPGTTETVYDREGNRILTRGPSDYGKPLTEGQAKMTVFQTDMSQASEVLGELEKTYDPTNLQDQASGILGDKWGSFLQSADGQIYKSAAAQWLDSGIRIRTGAAATDDEVTRQYTAMFPQPGDAPKTVEYKRRARENFARSVDSALRGVQDPSAPAAPADMFTPSSPQPSAPSGRSSPMDIDGYKVEALD